MCIAGGCFGTLRSLRSRDGNCIAEGNDAGIKESKQIHPSDAMRPDTDWKSRGHGPSKLSTPTSSPAFIPYNIPNSMLTTMVPYPIIPSCLHLERLSTSSHSLSGLHLFTTDFKTPSLHLDSPDYPGSLLQSRLNLKQGTNELEDSVGRKFLRCQDAKDRTSKKYLPSPRRQRL